MPLNTHPFLIKSLLPLYYIMIISCSIESVSTFSLLLYKRFHDNSSLWSDRIFEPLTGFLLWVFLYSTFRNLYLIIITFGLMPDAIILKSIINFSGWAFIQFAIATYIAGIFRTIPKLTFHRPTACRQTKFIPTYHSVLFIYWIFVITVGLLVIILSYLRGYFQGKNDRNNLIISQAFLLIILSISNIVFNLCLFKYGRFLVVLTQESVNLTNGRDEAYNAYLNKLKTINFSLMVVVSWTSISFFLWSMCSLTIKVNMDIPAIMTFMTNTAYTIMIMAAIISIIRGELYIKGINNADINLSTISNVRWSETSFGQTNSVIET
ncbi:hypothetical protein RclHR1_02480026 [Rhizophagus clarus]|uniref:G-protein coupled receptors family 1 profile domain-containing protein n=1 Tax=Rhizophagus clarus TaxID=94130 RepID=A0A2Z6QY12_9GLOM|nr:hypothetical protein RclHR1_02480026 [Rhizophagus clarus]GET02830.1 hypothetical protein GLOIN_2v1713768 [Rhizophagus clarus]